jgi:hypothetical protein
MTAKKTDALLSRLADGKLISSDLRIEFVNFSGNSCQIKVFAVNKVGKFQLYPQIGQNEMFFSVGQSLTMGNNKNFKLKTKLKIS